MNDEILDENFDEIEEIFEVGNEPIHASKSFNQFIFSILVYLTIFIIPSSSSTTASHIWEEDLWGIEIIHLFVGLGVGVIVLLLNIFGMVNAAKSERFQEKNSWKKYVGAVGNMLMFFPSVVMFLEFIFGVLNLLIY